MNAFAALLQTVAPDPAFCTRLTIALAHQIWQGMAIAALSLVAGRLLLRRSANLRYAVHVATLVLFALCLPATYCLVEAPPTADGAIGGHPAAPLLADTDTSAFDSIHVVDESPTNGEIVPAREPLGPPAESPANAAVPSGSTAGTDTASPEMIRWWRQWVEPAAPYATGIYFLGALVMSLRLMLGLWGGHRLRRSALPVTDQALLEAVRRQAKQLGLRFVPVVAWCRRVSTPIVVGIVTPAVLLPASLAGGLTPDQLSALLVHELAHIRRFDLVVNLLQRIVETLLFFHAAVWYLSRQISRERENCCDDCVLAAGWRGTDYAGALLRMAELCLAGRADATSLAVLGAAAARPSEFKRRVLRLLGIETPSPLRLSRLGFAVLGSLLTLALASPALTHPPGNREVEKQLPVETGVRLPQEEAPVEGRGQEALLAQAGGGEKPGLGGLRVYGRVLDASTGKPVEECRVIPTSVFDEKTHQYTWQPQYRKPFKDGAYEWKTDRPWEMTRLRIEAQGYRPAVSRAIKRGEGAVEIDVRLTPDEGITGVVLTPDGKPAAEAQLALATWTFEVTVRDGELRQSGHAADLGVTVVYADDNGKFRLPPEVDPAVLVVAHESGYAEVDVPGPQALLEKKVDGDDDAAGAAKTQDLEIKLLRWGRVEGWVRAGDKPVEGARFWVGSGYIKRSDLVNIHAGDDATSDADGRFAVERVPPGRGWCQRHVPDAKGTGSVGISGLDVQFDLPTGECIPLEIGGRGRTVVGKVRPPEGFAKKIDWSKVTMNVFPRAPHIGFGGDNAMWSAWSAFLKTDEGRPYNREGIAIAADGSFRIEGLPAADYQVVISVPGAAIAEEPQPKGTVANGGGAFRISAVGADGDDKPFDAGVFKLVLAKAQSKETAKDDANAEGPATDTLSLRATLTLGRAEFQLGESIAVEYEMTNTGQQPVPYGRGGYYPDLRWNDGFRISAVKIDGQQKPIGKPVANWPAPESHGGPVGTWQLKPGERYAETLFVTRVARFAEPGRYRIRVENTGREKEKVYSAAETIVTLKAPTAEQAREVFQAMKRASRKAYDDNAMKFLGDAADFETMHQPVYLPILRELALKGDVDALPSLERMETLQGNEALVAALARALEADDVVVARACYRHLQPSLPFPNWYDEGNGDSDKPRRERSDRTWKAEFVPTLTRLARRLIPEVAFQIRTMGDTPELLQKSAQPLLGEIDYIYRCVGRPDDFADCMKAYAQSVELTKTLPLEKHQYFRPRGSAFGFGHTVFRMMQRGAPAPTKPAHPGEAATFAMALRTQKDFRPAWWEAEVMKWLKAGPPYLAEVILDHLPEPIPDAVLDWLPQALASDYIDLAIAGCKIAEKHPRAAYKAPLQKLVEIATEQYLIKFSRTAAKANGLDVGEVNDE